ncbi:hypothetical protein E4U59_007098 [Claviceps monticola]|nr:hypothetical protein E4U59_007098 [Claviceps monticola]
MALPHTNAHTLNAILDTDIPYLDATLGQCIRLAKIVPRIVRVSREDTEVLGIYIPKGAEIMCTTLICGHSLGRSPTYGARNIRQDEINLRVDQTGQFTDDLHIFSPERWLDDAGAFNSQAVPKLAFSGGPRVFFSVYTPHATPGIRHGASFVCDLQWRTGTKMRSRAKFEQAGSLRRAMQELHIFLVVLLMKFRLESAPDEESELNSMQSQPMTLRVQRQTFVQLTNLGSSVGE